MPKVVVKKKCCRDKALCAKCPLMLMRLVKMGYAEKDDKTHYRVSARVPRKALILARAR